MGIKDLLKNLFDALESNVQLSRFKGKTVGIDASIWKFKGMYGVIGKKTIRISVLKYFLRRIKLMEENGITPYFVFDGRPYPAKRATHEERAEKIQLRIQMKFEGTEQLQQELQNQNLSQSEIEQINKEILISKLETEEEVEDIVEKESCTVKDVSNLVVNITSTYDKYITDMLKSMNIQFIVAPYEADHQLIYLQDQNIIQGIMTEDSDFIALGGDNILYKFKLNKGGQLYRQENLKLCPIYNQKFGLEGLQSASLLAGCDYIKSLYGIGFTKAYGIVNRTKKGTLSECVKLIRKEGKYEMHESYLQDLRKARQAFRYPVIYDPVQRQQLPLCDYPDGKYDKDFAQCGEILEDQQMASEHALGFLDNNFIRHLPEDSNETDGIYEFVKDAKYPKFYNDYFSYDDEIIKRKNFISEEGKFICRICPSKFKHTGDRFQHEQYVHIRPEEKRTFSCRVCYAIFTTLYSLTRHIMTVHTEDRNFICEVCGESFKREDILKEHLKSHSEERTYKCEVCGESFKLSNVLYVHKKIHSEERKYICEICGEAFKRIDILQEHLKIHSEERKYKCDVCGESFKLSNALYVHKKIHSEERNFICEICGGSFKRRDALQEHLKTHSEERKYKCEVCGKAFKRINALQEHLKTHSEERKHICKICGEAFKTSGVLNVHKKTHSEERKYICKICGEAFKFNSSLYYHKKIHSEERKHKCKICGEAFKRLDHLKRHLKTHLGKSK